MPRRFCSILAVIVALTSTAVAGPDLLQPIDPTLPPPALLGPDDAPRMDDPVLWQVAGRRGPEIDKLFREYMRDRGPEARARGLGEIRRRGDMAELLALLIELQDGDDFKPAVLDHVATQGAAGQGVLAWAAVHHDDPAVRTLALARLDGTAGPPVRSVVDVALRGPDHLAASRAAVIAGVLNIADAIPLLIAGMTAEIPAGEQGDLAWIAVTKQTAYVERLEPVVGDASGAFQPVVATLSEGFVFRVQDAVVVIYRAAVHHTLVAMTTFNTGEATAHLGYDKLAWIAWYNAVFVPWKNEQLIIADLMKEPEKLK